MATLGIVPMGLAIYFWDYGMKRGDIQTLGAFSYVEPFIGAVLVALFTSEALDWKLLWSGTLVLGGAVLASASLWPQVRAQRDTTPTAIGRRAFSAWGEADVHEHGCFPGLRKAPAEPFAVSLASMPAPAWFSSIAGVLTLSRL